MYPKQDPFEKEFTYIYDHNVWNDKSKSGGGSLIRNCYPYVFFLKKFLKEHNITTVLDLGCGDFSYAKFIKWDGIEYIGVDVVKQNAEENTRKYGSSNVRFLQGNIIDMDLPDADLVICKHVLQHIPNKDVFKLLEKLKKYPYCILTDQIESDSEKNVDIPIGSARPLDLLSPPFNLVADQVFQFKIGSDRHQSLVFVNDQF